jgi:hypothetical protein
MVNGLLRGGLLKLERLLILGLIVVTTVRPFQAARIDDLQAAFKTPPADARIMMRWWWFGPAVSKAELEREMRLMKEGGIGGFEVQPVYPVVLDDQAAGIKTLPFLSDEFIDVLRFTSEKARELGLRFDLTLGSGWPFGGPTVTIDHSAARLRYEHIKVDSNSRLVKVPSIGVGEKLLGVFVARPEGSSFTADSIKELTDIRDGVVHLPAIGNDPHEVLFFISSRTGMQVKRPAVGGEGFVLDHMNRAATDSYLKNVGDRLMQAFGSNPPYAIFCDSLEVYNSDWSADFLEEFKRRRGYDLKPYLPALVNEIGPQTKGLRRDWGMTLTELLNERFLAPMHEWSKRNRTLFRIQDYGVPAAAISSNAYADLPEGEGPQWKVVRATRWASSASHIYGRPVTSSETWTWLHSPSFRATPLDVKAEADLHFLQGVNQLIGHGWPYAAPGIEYPGWRFYAAGVFNEKNPWWIVMPDVSAYLQRVSYLMRQGKPVNDVAVYLPNDDGWAHFTPGNTHLIEILRDRIGTDLLPAILESGYNLDFFDDEAFRQLGSVEKNTMEWNEKLVTKNASLVLGQNKYRIVILPYVGRIPLDTYRKLEEFVRAGGILIATRRTPLELPGFLATPQDHKQIVEISKGLFEGATAGGRFVADEKAELRTTLNRVLQPDVAFSPSVPELGFVHRQTGDSEIYFVANTSNTTQQVKATFRVHEMNPELWDPFDGSVKAVHVESRADLKTTLALDLEPYGSRVIVFTRRTLTEPKPLVTKPGETIDLSSGWQVKYGLDAPAQTMQTLSSWTNDEATRYFSGVAVYEKEITLSPHVIQSSTSLRLDFGAGKPIPSQALRAGMQAWFEGPVREAAVVYVNGQRAGSVWCPPYSVEIKDLLRPGVNKLRVLVSNTAVNYMAGHSLPDYRLLNLRYGERFQPQDMDKIQPVTSGLLGPIQLIQGGK